DPVKLQGVVVDDSAALLSGHWEASRSGKSFVGDDYQHDGKAADGQSTARFEAKLPKAGRYEVRIATPHNPNRASNVPVEVISANGSKTVTVNQKTVPPIENLFVSLGTYEFAADKPAAVIVSNKG